MEVASALFYQQGYRATGINEVIQKSGVAKATFYNHYPSKDDLCLAYLKNVVATEMANLDENIRNTRGAMNKYLFPIKWLKPWLEATNFRGCPFLHIVAEVPDPESPLRKEGEILYDEVAIRVRKNVDGLIESDPGKYGHLDADAVTMEYVNVFAGAIALGEIYNDVWPVDHAVNTAKRLIGE